MDRSVTKREVALRKNSIAVEALRSSYLDGRDIREFREALCHVIRNEAWKERLIDWSHGPEVVGFKTFEEFVLAPPRNGLNGDVESLRLLCSSDPEAMAVLDAELTGAAGDNQYTKEVRDNVTDQRQGGNALGYTLRRLKRDHPELFARVIAKELSANAAAIEAGFRKKLTPLTQLQRAWTKADDDERDIFARQLKSEGWLP